jgi:hypothetical protein
MEEIDLFTGSPSLPVVYCILDPLDSVYRVQLTKTFYGERSAQELGPCCLNFDRKMIDLDPEILLYEV